MRWLSGGCCMPSRSAARVMWPSSATAMKYRRCFRSMPAYLKRYEYCFEHIIDRLAPKCYSLTHHSIAEDVPVALSRRRFLHLTGGVATLPAIARVAVAQTFPARPISLVVPFPAGGPADVIARILGEGMRAPLGQPLVVENVAGAGGSVGITK